MKNNQAQNSYGKKFTNFTFKTRLSHLLLSIAFDNKLL